MSVDHDEKTNIANLLNCKIREFPIVYLGLPSSDKTLRNSNWDLAVYKATKCVDSWQGKLMSSGERLTLTNAYLLSIPSFAMGLFLLGSGMHSI